MKNGHLSFLGSSLTHYRHMLLKTLVKRILQSMRPLNEDIVICVVLKYTLCCNFFFFFHLPNLGRVTFAVLSHLTIFFCVTFFLRLYNKVLIFSVFESIQHYHSNITIFCCIIFSPHLLASVVALSSVYYSRLVNGLHANEHRLVTVSVILHFFKGISFRFICPLLHRA